MHRQLTLPALKAKKDVFVEWPLGRTLAEAEEMAALAKSMGVKTVVGLQARQAPSIRKVRIFKHHCPMMSQRSKPLFS